VPAVMVSEEMSPVRETYRAALHNLLTKAVDIVDHMEKPQASLLTGSIKTKRMTSVDFFCLFTKPRFWLF
jgi:hypothetical protein